jgi:hypothetical protein
LYDAQLHLDSFARNLHRDFDATGSNSSAVHSEPPVEILVMANKQKKRTKRKATEEVDAHYQFSLIE